MPSKRKQQTRLAFSPLPSSSPASKDYNRQIRDRAATVTIEGSQGPAKNRQVKDRRADDSETLPSNDDGAVSIAAVQTLADDPFESDEDPMKSSQRRLTSGRVKSRSRQPRLDFSKTRDASSLDASVRLPSSSARTQSTEGGTMFSSQVQGRMVELSSDESDGNLPSVRKIMNKTKAKSNGKRSTVKADAQEQDVGSDEDDIVAPRRRSQKSTAGPLTRSSRTEVLVDSDDEGIVARAPRAVHISGEEEEGEEDDMPTTAGTQRRRRRPLPKDDFVVDSPTPEDSDEDLIEVKKSSRKRRRGSPIESCGDSDKTPKTPSRRRIKRARQAIQQEKDDLAEDLDFLGPSSDVDSSSRPARSTQSAHKSAREKALERLKRARGANPGQSQEEEDPAAQTPADSIDEASGSDEVIEIDEDEDEEAAAASGFVSSRQMFKEDAEDADFLAEDGDDILGAPEDIPIEFTRYASMKPKELFEFAVEWMVQKKINPAFQKDDPLYQLTFKKLDDNVRGLAASKFTSSAWTAIFTIALNARPEMRFDVIDRGAAEHWMRDKCDACNRTNHPATYEIQFIGKPYHRDTLEDIDNGEDDDSESDSDDSQRGGGNLQEYDANGVDVASTDTIFYVGKFCCANARTAHQLQHWRYHLNAYVEVWLERQGYGRADELSKRDKWSTKKRRKYANKILDRMKVEGEVKVLWNKFRESIEEARNSKQGRFEALTP
ncbi:hypothetical protein AC579_9961 [Pseudocercospora musae]|uniref:DUF4211 domain-containing protein n=1 Tax=Pseudocercospora musae TaxID=113226 RepID=A0A139IM07_9PEZI|nr:hypothetical protein AC579_9961 [Pseudocercospora musae]